MRPAWAHACGCKSRCELVTVSKAKRNCVRATECGKEAWSINRLSVDKNRIEGVAEQGERARNNKMTGETALVDGKSSAVADVPSSKDALVRGQVYQTARGPASLGWWAVPTISPSGALFIRRGRMTMPLAALTPGQ